MSADPTWLQTLQQATTYRELQTAFDLMWSEANSTTSGSSRSDMIARIEEAIRRIEQERIRDEAELAEFNNQYASFKDQNAGVVGWFKRKMPFTATRKQDVELRDSMRDQEVEILADNFVIAHAEMLKESLLPPTAARCGQPSHLYREQLAAHDSVHQLRNFGNIVLQISSEIPRAEHFIAELRTDIEAFAAAKFADKDDNHLKKLGLDKAQQALSSLVSKVNDKKSLMAAAHDRLRQLVEQDLSEHDPAFRTLQQHLVQINAFMKQSEQTKPILEARVQSLSKLKHKVNELTSLPEKLEALREKFDKAQAELRTAESAFRQAENEAQPIRQRYDAARQAAEQARLRVEATQPLVQAYLSEQGLDLSAVADHASTSPVCAEYESLKAAAEAGQAQLHQVTAHFETSNRQLQQQQAELDKLSKVCSDYQQQANKLTQEEESGQRELTNLCDQYRMDKHAFQASAENWISARAALSWHPQLSTVPLLPAELTQDLFAPNLVSELSRSTSQSPMQFPGRHSSTPFSQKHGLTHIEETFTRFQGEFTQAVSNSKKIQQQLSQEQTRALQQRSHILLDSELATKLFPIAS